MSNHSFGNEDKAGSHAGTDDSHVSDSFGSSENSPTDVGGFSVAPSGFDPKGKKKIAKHYENKEKKGTLPGEDQFEDSVEDEIEQKIAAFEKEARRKASDEEREAMGEAIRKFRHSSWLGSVKSTLVGKSEVPIEYFNCLVDQYEATIPSVANQVSKLQEKADKKDKEIEDLKKKNATLTKNLEEQKSSKAPPSDNDDPDDVHGKCRLEVSQLEQELKTENEALEMSLMNMEDLQKEIDALKQQPGVGEENIQELMNQNQDLAGWIEDLENQLEHAKGQTEHMKKQHDELEAELQECLGSKTDIGAGERKKLEAEIDRLTKRSDGLEAELEAFASIESDNYEADRKHLEEEIDHLTTLNKKATDDLERIKKSRANDKTSYEQLEGQIAQMFEHNSELEAELKECRASKTNGVHTDAKAKKLETETNRLQKRVAQLELELEKKPGASTTAPAPSHDSDADLLQHIEDLEEQIKTLSTTRDAFRNRWAAGFTAKEQNEHLRQFWNVVENTQAKMGSFQGGVQTLYTNLGFTAKYVDTKAALDKMTKASTNTASAPLGMQLLSAKLEAKDHELKAYQLANQLANAPSSKTDDEIKMELGIYEDEEMERRVTARTQSYRLHRRAYLETIFNAGQELEAVVETIPDDGTKSLIRRVCTQYLSPNSLPLPPAPVFGRV